MAKCRCHADAVYSCLVECPDCGHNSYDEGIGCERRSCGSTTPVAQSMFEAYR